MRGIIVIGAAALVLFGCAANDMQDLNKYISDVKSRAPTPIDPIPQIKQAETYLYAAGNRRDPFTPESEGGLSVDVAGIDGPRPDLNRRKEELESYSLDAMSMVGTLQQKADNWGLVQTEDGTIHRVKPGNYLGRNYGLITGIDEDRIDLRELIQDGSGAYLERQASLTLGEK